jgi:hypothetical protein
MGEAPKAPRPSSRQITVGFINERGQGVELQRQHCFSSKNIIVEITRDGLTVPGCAC